MNRLRALSLRAKLNLGLLGLLVVVGLATAALLLLGLHRTQENATETSRAGLEEQSQETLSVISDVQSTVGELQLNATAELGLTAARFLSDAQFVPQAPETDPARLAVRGPVVFDPTVGRPTDIWYRGPLPLTGQAAEDLALSSPLDTLFRTLVNSQGLIREENFEAVAIYYIGPSGLLRYFPVVGMQDRLDPGFDILADQRYQLGTPENDPARSTVWTAPYRNPAGQDLLLTAITPVYIGDEFRGVIGVDLSLARLIDQVDLITVGASGFGFYVDSSGSILPSKSAAPINAALARDENGQLRATIENMRQGLSGTDRIVLDGREVFISYAPVAGPGGSLAVVAPVDEVTAAANDVTSSIESEGNRTIGATLLTMVALFVATLFVTAWLNRRVLIRPIEALVAGTDAVARGDLETKIPVRTDDELGLLARSFNRMTEQLQSSRQELEASGARFRGIFEATTDGVIINDPHIRGIALANPAAYRMFGYEPGELDRLDPRRIVDDSDHAFFDRYAEAMEQDRPYNGVTTGKRKDGSTFPMAVSGSTLEFGGRVHHFAIVRDITEEVRAYELLEERVEERTRELSTLLRVSQSVGSTLDLDALLELILTQLHDVIEYSSASVLIREGDELRILMSKGGPQPEALRTDLPLRIRLREAGPIWEPLQRGEGVIIDDVRGDSPLAVALQQAVGDITAPGFEHIRSWMAVPFLAKGETVGFLSVARREPGSFEQRHAELATAFAGQAASALENAHLFAEADRRARENAALAAIAALFTLDQPLHTTLDALARSVCEATTASASSVILLDEGEPSGFGGWGLPPGYMDTVARCLARGAPWPALDAVVAGHPRFVEHGRTETLNQEAWADLHPFLTAVPWESMYFLPIIYRGRAVGSLATYYSPVAPPSAEERSFLQAISDQAAVGLENRTLFSQAKRRIR
ncbi:MAG: GAF domain-containing protein, partial [Hyphomicrobiales bacterium]